MSWFYYSEADVELGDAPDTPSVGDEFTWIDTNNDTYVGTVTAVAFSDPNYTINVDFTIHEGEPIPPLSKTFVGPLEDFNV